MELFNFYEDNNPTYVLNGNSLFAESLFKEKIMDDKEMVKFIKNVERIVRSSIEYNNLMKYIKTELNLDFCSYLNQLDFNDVSIEIHHTPYNLHQIVNIVINKNEALMKPFNSMTVAFEVLSLHYSNLIGLCSLSKTMHELVHSENKFYIHKDLVLGDVDKFFSLYNEYMTDELKQVYYSWIEYSNENQSDRFNTLEMFRGEKREFQLNQIKKFNSNLIENNKE